MEPSTIALIVCFVAVVLYITEIIPIAVTSLLSMLAMALTGVITVSQAFSAFGNSTVILVMALMIIGKSFFTTGIAEMAGRKLANVLGNDEKKVIIALYLVSTCMSMFVNPVAVLSILFAIADTIIAKSEGAVTRKQTYLAMAVASTFAGQLTAIGTSSMLTASALLSASGYGRGINIFEPTLITFGGVLIPLIFYLTIGHKMQEKWFDFPDVAPVEADATVDIQVEYKVWKMVATSLILLLCILGIVFKVADYGAIALLGACVLIVIGCLNEKEAWNSVGWSTIFVVVGSLGLAEGLDKSGAGRLIAEAAINTAGPLAQSPFAMCALMMIVAVVLSSLMSDTATVGICFPITLAICKTLGIDPLPFVIAIARGANIGIFTPICTATITMTTVAGYRFKDYFRLGGLFTLGATVTSLIGLYFVYFI